LISLCLLAWFILQYTDQNPSGLLAPVSKGGIESRATELSSQIENRIITKHIVILSSIEELLEFNETPPEELLYHWLQDHPDVISIMVWKSSGQEPMPLTQKWFYNDPKILALAPDQRELLFAYILQSQSNPLGSSQPYLIGKILHGSLLDYPIIAFGIPLRTQWLQALEMKIRFSDWESIFDGALRAHETIGLIDSTGHILFATERPLAESWRTQPYQQVIIDPDQAVYKTSFSSLPWTLLYQRSLDSATKTVIMPQLPDIIILSIIFLTATIFSLFLTWWVKRPVKKLATTASEIARGNFGESIPLVQNEEMNRLIRLFNYMAEEMSRMNKLDVSEIIGEKNKTEAILRNIADAVVVTDPEDRILVVNYVAEKCFGINDAEVRMKPIEQSIENESLLSLIKAVKERNTHVSTDFDMISPVTGEKKVFQAHAAGIQNRENALVGVVTAIRDVTQETEANQVKTELVSMVAHELKSPLTSIYGFSELLLEDDLGANKIKEYATVILNESTRLTDLVNKFLDLSRLESGRTEIHVNPFDLKQVIAKILDTYKAQAEKKHIKVITDISDNLPLAMGDPDMIEQVLLNLYSNAVKYSPERSKVGIEIREEQKELIVSVIDNGFGIPKESLPYIFDKFYRVVDAENESEIEGSGLGLTLAREIIERHGGKMTVNSRLGIGSVFSFTLPVVDGS